MTEERGDRPRKRTKRSRAVRPEEVVESLDAFFWNFVTAAKERLRRDDIGEIFAAQLLFRPGLELECRFNDEVALRLTFDDGRASPLLAGDNLHYVRSQNIPIASVAPEPEAVGHITVLVGQPIAVYHVSGLVLPDQGSWAGGIAAWDLRQVMVEALGTPESEAGQDLLKRLRPRRGWQALREKLDLTMEDWLPSALADLILEGEYEDEAVALLPLEYLHVEGQEIVLWRGWLGEKRPADNVLRELARTALDEDVYGRGVESRRSKWRVLTESQLAETSGDDKTAFSLDSLSASTPDSSLRTDRGLDAVAANAGVRRLLPLLPRAEREAMELLLQGNGDQGNFVRLCGGPGRRYDRMRKALERARKRLKKLAR